MNSKMPISQVVILAGGLGTRLRPITQTIPKPLVPVAGRPFLSWQLADVKRCGFKRVLLLVGYLGEQIRAEFGDGSQIGMDIQYATEQVPLGTGGAVQSAMALLDNNFVLLNGDSFQRVDFDAMVDDYYSRDLSASVSAFASAKVTDPSIANMKVSGGLVTEYRRDGGRHGGFEFIDSGVYVLSRNIFNQAPNQPFALEELWPRLISQQKLGAFMVAERYFDIGTPERLKIFEESVHGYF